MTAEPSGRHPIEQLAEEFVSRYRRGERPSVGEQGGVHFYAMQFIEGQGLDEVVEAVKRLRAPAGDRTPPRVPPSTAEVGGPAAATTLTDPDRHYYESVARIGLQVAEALAYA